MYVLINTVVTQKRLCTVTQCKTVAISAVQAFDATEPGPQISPESVPAYKEETMTTGMLLLWFTGMLVQWPAARDSARSRVDVSATALP